MFKPCIFFLLALLSSLRTETCIGSFLPNAKSSNGAVSPTMSEFPEIERENFLTMLSQKVSIVANIPIFEFGQDVTDFLKRAEDESGCVNPSTMIDLEIIFYDYMVKLRSYYFLIFSNFQSRTFLDGLQPIRMYLIEERDYCVGQCKKAMQSALPATIHTDLWSFQGPLLELESDIDASIEEAISNLPSGVDDDSVGSKFHVITRRSLVLQKFWRRFKWVAVQTALLAFNFAQNEWNRRSLKHSADRRLAEVPEFPLL